MIVNLPVVPEAVVAMLACARLGAVHSVVFGGFAAHELALRIDDATARSSCRPRAGSRSADLEYEPLLIGRHRAGGAPAGAVRDRAAPAADGGAASGRDVDWA